MYLKFDYYDVREAIQLLVKEKLDIDIDLEDMCPHDNPSICYQERILAFKKHKNGKEVKDANGFREVDWEKVTWKKKYIDFDDSCEITFYVEK